MAEKLTLATAKREASKHSARDARAANQIPGIIYGHGVDPILVTVDYSEFLRTFRKALQSSLIDLEVAGKTLKVLVHEYMLDPVKDTFAHIDFYAVNLKEKTTVHVPFVFDGVSDAVKNQGGVFLTAHTSIDIKCLPADIPHDIVVNIESIKNLNETITVESLNLPKTLEVENLTPETVICSVSGHASSDEDLDAPVEAPAAEAEAAA